MATQRLGPLSRMIYYSETAWDADTGITKGYVIPLAAVSAFATDQPLTAADVYTGKRDPRGSVLGMIAATGNLPIALEFTFIGHVLEDFFGDDVYSRAGSLHRWNGAGMPGSAQFEKQWLEAPPIFVRNMGIKHNQITFTQAMSGQAQYTLASMGSGKEAYESVAGAEIIDEGYSAVNYFNGYIKKDGVSLATVTAFNLTLSNTVSRQDAAFLQGRAAGLNPGLLDITGTLGLIFEVEAGLEYYMQAIQETNVTLECYWANKPLSVGPTQWIRIVIPEVRFSRGGLQVGGAPGILQSQNFRAQLPNQVEGGGMAAEIIGSAVGPYDIQLGINDKLSLKVDGGAPTTITLTPGAARTAAEIADEINTGTAGCTAEDFSDRVKIASDTVGATTSKLEFVTVANDAYTTLGFATGEVTGIDSTSILVELCNAQTADYAPGG